MGRSHSDSFQFNTDAQSIGAILRDPRFAQFVGVRFLNELPEAGGTKFCYDTSVSMTSWGEIIEIHVSPMGPNASQVLVKSKCAAPTQLFDMGKNKGNVAKIHQYLASAVGAQQAYTQPPQQTYTQPPQQTYQPVPQQTYQPPVQQMPGYATRICRNCGTQQNGTTRFCPMCGTQLF